MESSNTLFDKINYLFKEYKLLLLFILIVIFIFFLFLFLIISLFIAIKILQISLDRMVLFYDYNKLCKKKIKKYGNCEISKIYLIKNLLDKKYTFFINLATLFQYDNIIKQSEENIPYHTMLLLEVKLENNEIKWLLLEKNNCITINDNFILTQGMKVEEVELKKEKEKKIYLKDFLEETRNRIGNEKFFNWNIFENNCQEFTKECIVTLGKYDDYYKKIIYCDKMLELMKPTDFIYHIFNFSCIIYNFLEKYIFEIDLF